MSLRLLPAFVMDNEEDDDGNFTKWMSSYWGHGAETGQSRERKRSFRRPAKTRVDRRSSLPCVSQLDAMKLNKLHAAAMAPSPIHSKTREEKGEVRPHPRARRASSDDNSRLKTAIPESRISTIPELTESFEKRLSLRNKNTMSLGDEDNLCLICHEDLRNGGGGVQELHCTHRFHKEYACEMSGSLCMATTAVKAFLQTLPPSTLFHKLSWSANPSTPKPIPAAEVWSPQNSFAVVGGHDTYMMFFDPWVWKAARRLEQSRFGSSSATASCEMWSSFDQRRKSVDEPFGKEQKYLTPHRQLSLRRHR
ncbi:leukemia NUP98 fusion partner 1 [Lampris incognitus]|uniref:leukemia NUP98 fusion partner 1 n=1 Tax=Lampris incognitus TaxID=2546036 RepID=UPI0024B4891F|nr:leukemia NUP98 fusion partner 1 [Lampris incognitus]